MYQIHLLLQLPFLIFQNLSFSGDEPTIFVAPIVLQMSFLVKIMIVEWRRLIAKRIIIAIVFVMSYSFLVIWGIFWVITICNVDHDNWNHDNFAWQMLDVWYIFDNGCYGILHMHCVSLKKAYTFL